MSASGSSLKVLFVGESWIKHVIHMKGFDQFHSTEYEEGAQVFLDCLADAGHEVTYVRGHEISMRFPRSAQELDEFDVVVISDIGSNSFLLPDETFLRGQESPNRLELVADFVRGGGGLVKIGGYLSFTGIDGKARFGRTPLAAVLPVTMLDHDDRVEKPEGVDVTVCLPEHPVLGDTPSEWPRLLGYNQLIAKTDATTVAMVGDDPMLVTGEFGSGRSVAFASDLAPHWAPQAFLDWAHYAGLWNSILAWAAQVQTTRG
ncbi:glutamine amidotransferase [Nocardioides daejeonensis]|uniref:glutamine amidotransferase n=1 Tax=Nocardioides daejeonensis TaxID=1046556 RepID=UPI000D74F5DF|nr:glutamine amidotransferase [Nocardioides daejeonensis]